MALADIWNKLIDGGLVGRATVLIIILLSLIQFSPLKLDPWTRILKWISRIMNEETEKKLTDLQKQVMDMWVSSRRNCILTFAREARDGVCHSNDEWANCLNMIDSYETYCRKNSISNGIVKADSEYIRNLYQELSRERKI